MDNETINSQGQAGGEANDQNSQSGADSRSSGASSGAQDRQSNPQESVQNSQQSDFRSHPAFKGIQSENRRYKQELENLKRQQMEMQAYMDGLRKSQGGQQQSLSQEDESALMNIVEALTKSEKAMERLGLKKIGELDKRFSELSDSWTGSQYESEFRDVLSHAKSIGLDPEEVRQELEEALETHPVFSKTNYWKGGVMALFRDKYFDRAGEFKERLANKETIEKREALKRGQVQSPNAQGAKGKALNAQQKFNDVVKQAGGIQNIDWTR